MPVVSRRGLDERSTLLPPEVAPFFDDAFVRSCDLIEEYVARLVAAIARETGIERAIADGAGTAGEIVARAGLDPGSALVPAGWILGMIRAREWSPPLPDLDPREIEAEQEAHDPRCLPSYRIAALAAASYPGVLRGALPGERALFAPDRMEAWAAYFSNDNPLYAISNHIAALAAERAFGEEPGAVLELGGGLGSGAESLLARLSGKVTSYRFTELSLPFLRRAQRSLAARHPATSLTFARLDVDRPFSEGGVVPGAYALVHAVNVVHVAKDMAFTLGEIREALAPGGVLVAGECVRPFAGRPIYVELVFNLLEAFRREEAGFKTPEAWEAHLKAAGFDDVRLVPDVRVVREAYPSFVVSAILATRP